MSMHIKQVVCCDELSHLLQLTASMMCLCRIRLLRLPAKNCGYPAAIRYAVLASLSQHSMKQACELLAYSSSDPVLHVMRSLLHDTCNGVHRTIKDHLVHVSALHEDLCTVTPTPYLALGPQCPLMARKFAPETAAAVQRLLSDCKSRLRILTPEDCQKAMQRRLLSVQDSTQIWDPHEVSSRSGYDLPAIHHTFGSWDSLSAPNSMVFEVDDFVHLLADPGL